MLAFFIPGIVYLADAVGTQTETVVVRGLSLGIPMRRMVARELLAGILIGVVLAAVALPWDDAQFVSSHSKDIETAVRLAKIHPKVGVLTAPNRGLAELVDGLAGRGKTFVLAEKIGGVIAYARVIQVMITGYQ